MKREGKCELRQRGRILILKDRNLRQIHSQESSINPTSDFRGYLLKRNHRFIVHELLIEHPEYAQI